MSGQTVTVVGCIVSFALLFGIYMSLRHDFVFKKRTIDEGEEIDGSDGPDTTP